MRCWYYNNNARPTDTEHATCGMCKKEPRGMQAMRPNNNRNKSVLSLVPRLSTRRCQRLLLSAGAAYQLSVDICCRRQRSAANQPHASAAVDRRDRQTDRRTPDRFIDPAVPHTMRIVSLKRCMRTIRSCTVFARRSSDELRRVMCP